MRKDKWDKLRVANYRTLAEEFREECEEYCDSTPASRLGIFYDFFG